jgi:hypothetical protein
VPAVSPIADGCRVADQLIYACIPAEPCPGHGHLGRFAAPGAAGTWLRNLSLGVIRFAGLPTLEMRNREDGNTETR